MLKPKSFALPSQLHCSDAPGTIVSQPSPHHHGWRTGNKEGVPGVMFSAGGVAESVTGQETRGGWITASKAGPVAEAAGHSTAELNDALEDKLDGVTDGLIDRIDDTFGGELDETTTILIPVSMRKKKPVVEKGKGQQPFNVEQAKNDDGGWQRVGSLLPPAVCLQLGRSYTSFFGLHI